jgi:hypothetical protein
MSISYLNSLTPRNVVSGFVFTGVYDDILSASQITTRITANVNTDNNYTLLIEYSNDKVNVVSFETSTVIFDYNKLIYFTPTSRYFKLTLTANGDINDLSIETIFKHAIVYQAVNQISGFVFVDNLPEIQAISGNVAVTNWPTTNGDVNIISSIALDTNVISLPAINITNTAFESNITASIALDTNVISLPAINITNTGFNSNITAIDNTLTFLTQERPTSQSYFTTSVGSAGLAISLVPKVLRNFSINTTSAVIVFIYLYDTGVAPVITDTPLFVFPIQSSNNIIFNSFDHHFIHGIGIRGTTTYNGVVSPTANTVFVNMTLSD